MTNREKAGDALLKSSERLPPSVDAPRDGQVIREVGHGALILWGRYGFDGG